MHQDAIVLLAVVGPLLFGAAMGCLAYWMFDLGAAKLPFGDFLKMFTRVLGWFVGNGAIVLGGTYLADLAAALQGVPHGVAIVMLSYLAGFGGGILIRLAIPPKDRSLVGALHEHLNGRQVEAVLLVLRYGLEIPEAAAKMGISEKEFVTLFEAALRTVRQRWSSLKDLLKRTSNGTTS